MRLTRRSGQKGTRVSITGQRFILRAVLEIARFFSR
nr:MAG TPA: hypothetical protein [Bacteriophage sp.]DAM25819.1 MAG TPA: hypothetical protein [Caudoviricetes sp.]